MHKALEASIRLQSITREVIWDLRAKAGLCPTHQAGLFGPHIDQQGKQAILLGGPVLPTKGHVYKPDWWTGRNMVCSSYLQLAKVRKHLSLLGSDLTVTYPRWLRPCGCPDRQKS